MSKSATEKQRKGAERDATAAGWKRLRWIDDGYGPALYGQSPGANNAAQKWCDDPTLKTYQAQQQQND